MPKVFVLAEFGPFGGTRNYYLRLVEFYRSKGFEVVVGMPESQLDEGIRKQSAEIGYSCFPLPEWGDVVHKRWYRFPVSLVVDIWWAHRAIVRERPDVVTISVGTPGLLLGLIFLPIRVVYVLHTYPHGERWVVLGRSIRRRLISARLCAGRIFVTVSAYARAKLITEWVSERKAVRVLFIHNTAGELVPEISRVKNQGRITVLTLGHVAWYKGLEAWMATAEQVLQADSSGRVNFLWAGDGELLEEGRRRVAAGGLSDRVRFVGYVEDVASLYRTSDIYFQPSLVESHGISVIEGMRFGMPVVASNVGGLPESVEHGETGFLAGKLDCVQFAGHIMRLAEDDGLRREMGCRARERYEKEFSDANWVARMKDVHEKVLAG